jgi:hypothetical protein
MGIESPVGRSLGPPSSGISKDKSCGTQVTHRPLGIPIARPLGFRFPYRITGVWELIRFEV